MEACVSDNDVSESSEFEAGQAEGGQAEAGQETATAVAEAPVEATQAAPDAPRPLTDAERAKLAELDEQIARFEGQKRWSDVIKSILAKAEIHRERDEKVALLSLAGSMFLEKSSNQAEAIKAYEAVIQLDAKNLEALTRLKEMYEKRRDWEKLVGVMKLETELMDPSDRGLRYVEMAQLATEKLRKPEVCIDLWKSVLRLEPDNADALTNLAGLYEKAREWAPLAEILESQSTRIADEKELVAALNKLGMIYADKLGDDAGAVGAFKRLLTLDPNDRRAQEQLKKRFVSLKAWGDLEEFYATQDKWDELIRTLERETENKDAPAAEKIDLFFRIARLWAEKKDKTDRAAKSLEKVLELDPKNFEAAVALTPIYEAANDAKRLAGVYEVRLGHVSDPAERVLLLRESGLLYEERLKDPDTAFERFLEAFSLSPLTEVVREDVERVAAGVDGWDRVVAHYAAAIAKAETPVDAIELRMNLGRVLAAMGRTDEAIREFQSVWAAESDHLGAMAALETLFRATARFRELLAVYTRRAELESDPDARRKLAYDVAALYERELQNPPEAIDAYRGILAEYGDEDGEAHRALDRLYEGEGRWADLAAALERRIDLNPADEQELAALKYRLARTLEQRLDDKARAVDLYREILSLQPEHVGAREALEALLGDAAHGANAAEILEPIYELRGDAESLIKSLEVLHAASDDGARKLELLTKVGAVLQAQVGDADRAFEVYGRALRGAPASLETLESLEALASEPARHARLVALVSLLAGEHAESDAALSRTLWIKAARLNEGEGGDIDAAVAAYGRVLAQDSGDLEVLEALDALYRRSERWRDLLGVLRRKVELSADPAAQEALLEQMARIHDEQLSEPALAASLYREILEIEPTSQGALRAARAVERARRQRRAPARAGRGPRAEDGAAAPARRAARDADGGRRRRHRDPPPRPRDGSRQSRGARCARAAPRQARASDRHRGDPRTALPRAERLPEAHRHPRGAAPARHVSRSTHQPAPRHRRAARGRARRPARGARDVRARSRGGRVQSDDAGEPRAARGRYGRLRRAGRRVRVAGREAARGCGGERRGARHRARVVPAHEGGERPGRSARRGSRSRHPLPARAWPRRREPRCRERARASLRGRRELRGPRQDLPAQGIDSRVARRAEGTSLPRGRDLRGDPRASCRRDRGVSTRARARRRGAARSRQTDRAAPEALRVGTAPRRLRAEGRSRQRSARKEVAARRARRRPRARARRHGEGDRRVRARPRARPGRSDRARPTRRALPGER
jgi:tetratricopeptide (TPR) repeat protein